MPKVEPPKVTDDQKCGICGAELEMGYGLAGGGIGPYLYCPEHGILEKWDDPEMDDPSPQNNVKDT